HLRRAAMIDNIDSQFRTGVGVGKPTLTVAGAAPSGATSSVAAAKAEATAGPGAKVAAKSPTMESSLSELSEADLKRVADRISQMLGSAGGHAGHACTEACGFCQSCAEINPDVVRSFINLGADRIMHRGGGETVPKDIAKYIDHTLL